MEKSKNMKKRINPDEINIIEVLKCNDACVQPLQLAQKRNGKYILVLFDVIGMGITSNDCELFLDDEFDDVRTTEYDFKEDRIFVYVKKGGLWGAYKYHTPESDAFETPGLLGCSFEMVEDIKYDDVRILHSKCVRNYRALNYYVMSDTKAKYENSSELAQAICSSIERQFMVSHEQNIDQPKVENCATRFLASGKRTFEAACAYRGKKVAVLNYANNHSIGGAPFASSAQEESLCRCSTLLPCLQSMEEPFYKKHIRQFMAQEINHMGNDDLIYTPDVVVFKTDKREEVICPMIMDKEDWFKVDVITCAAPELWRNNTMPQNYEEQITSRIKKILDVAAQERVEVLILGAWGCGAFKNPAEIVARTFHRLVKNYNFEVVEFALGSDRYMHDSPFSKGLI